MTKTTATRFKKIEYGRYFFETTTGVRGEVTAWPARYQLKNRWVARVGAFSAAAPRRHLAVEAVVASLSLREEV